MIHKNNNGELPFVFTRSGRWWGTNPKTKSQEEIDLVLSTSDNKNTIFAECKWRNDLKAIPVLSGLMEKAEIFRDCENKYYYIFSKVDFSEKCKSLSDEMGNVKLVTLSTLFQ